MRPGDAGGPGTGRAMRVFLSVAGPDRPWARWIGQELRRAGCEVEYDEWSWPAGSSFLDRMDAALVGADRVLAIVSPAYLSRSTYGREEREAAQRLAHGRDGLLIPVLVADCELPPLLGRLSHVSLLGLDEAGARHAVLAALRGPRSPELAERMPFPGAGRPGRPPERQPTPGPAWAPNPPPVDPAADAPAEPFPGVSGMVGEAEDAGAVGAAGTVRDAGDAGGAGAAPGTAAGTPVGSGGTAARSGGRVRSGGAAKASAPLGMPLGKPLGKPAPADDGRLGRTVTILHLSDIQFGAQHLFGGNGLSTPADQAYDTLVTRLGDDLGLLRAEQGLAPDLLVVTGDLAETGRKAEFDQALECLVGLSERLGLARDRVVIVPGNHDVNQARCENYFRLCEDDGEPVVAPYWPKWQPFERMFNAFYEGVSEGVSVVHAMLGLHGVAADGTFAALRIGADIVFRRLLPVRQPR